MHVVCQVYTTIIITWQQCTLKNQLITGVLYLAARLLINSQTELMFH